MYELSNDNLLSGEEKNAVAFKINTLIQIKKIWQELVIKLKKNSTLNKVSAKSATYLLMFYLIYAEHFLGIGCA